MSPRLGDGRGMRDGIESFLNSYVLSKEKDRKDVKETSSMSAVGACEKSPDASMSLATRARSSSNTSLRMGASPEEAIMLAVKLGMESNTENSELYGGDSSTDNSEDGQPNRFWRNTKAKPVATDKTPSSTSSCSSRIVDVSDELDGLDDEHVAGSRQLPRSSQLSSLLRSTQSPNALSTQIEPSNASLPIIPAREAETRPSSLAETDRSRQGRLLLVSLLENFCMVYGQSPERNRKLFFVICRTLTDLGVLEEEWIDELSSVRSSYQKAFRQLFLSALQSLKREPHVRELLPPGEAAVMPDDDIDPWPAETSYDYDYDDDLQDTSRESYASFLAQAPFPDKGHFGHLLAPTTTRYANDFQQISRLGQGGFASVFCVRNKLDGMKYAVKKIRLEKESSSFSINDSEGIRDGYARVFREIKYLARLEHVNVIRYHNCWLEYVLYTNKPNKSSNNNVGNNRNRLIKLQSARLQEHIDESDIVFAHNTGSKESDDNGFSSDDDDSRAYMGSGGTSLSNNDYSQSAPHYSSEYGGTFDDASDLPRNKLSTSLTSDDSELEEIVDMRVNGGNIWNRDAGRIATESPCLTLFIQMQLCHSTLSDYILSRIEQLTTLPCDTDPYSVVDARSNLHLFRGIVQGVAYIHDRGLIHRDLKPSNIFLGVMGGSNWDGERDPEFGDWEAQPLPIMKERGVSDLVPKIGDFGLVTLMDEVGMAKGEPMRLTTRMDGMRTSGVGTVTYASPEQLHYPPKAYSQKSDIFSLGIIFFELYHPFTTAMERAHALRDLRNGVLPEKFVTRWPKEAALILWMMAQDPEQRPSARQILDFELLAEPVTIYTDLSTKLEETQKQLDERCKEVKEFKAKVASLEAKLKAHGVS